MQLEIMEHCAILSPDYFAPKDIINISMDIERFLKENPESTGEGKTNLDLFADFLRGDNNTTNPPDSSNSDEPVRII